jgi:hypothetical protein
VIISVLSAAFGLIVLVAAVLLGANEMTLASIFLLSAVPTLFLVARSLFKGAEEPRNWVVAIEDRTSWQHRATAAETEGCRICKDEIPIFVIRAAARKPTA